MSDLHNSPIQCYPSISLSDDQLWLNLHASLKIALAHARLERASELADLILDLKAKIA